MKKQGLGLIHHDGKEMVWGKGAKAGEFILCPVLKQDRKTMMNRLKV